MAFLYYSCGKYNLSSIKYLSSIKCFVRGSNSCALQILFPFSFKFLGFSHALRRLCTLFKFLQWVTILPFIICCFHFLKKVYSLSSRSSIFGTNCSGCFVLQAEIEMFCVCLWYTNAVLNFLVCIDTAIAIFANSKTPLDVKKVFLPSK